MRWGLPCILLFISTARDSAGSGSFIWIAACGTGADRPREYWLASSTPADLDDNGKRNERYGYFWWLAELDGKPIHYCRGFHGEYVVVIPDEDLVFVRTGMKREEVNTEGHPNDVYQWIAIARELASRKS